VELWSRQGALGLEIPTSACVVGVGGVGSWVALDLALLGVERLVLVDPDTVEESNLNRTPFKSWHVGLPKVTALAELIDERRATVVFPLFKKVEELTGVERALVSSVEVLFDCRDEISPLPFGLESKIRVLGGYDGLQISLRWNPSRESVWGPEDVRYSEVPSFLIPPQIIASLLILSILFPPGKGERAITLGVDELVRRLYDLA